MNASAILAGLARRLPRRGNGSLSLEAVPPFYLYDDPRLQFGWLLDCERIVKLRHTSAWERFAEVHLTRLLEHHPQRTRNASRALLFVVPIWEWTSFMAGDCNGTGAPRHRGRIARARAALGDSPHYWRNGGLDHVFASNAGKWGQMTISGRIGFELAVRLMPAIVGREHAYSLAPAYRQSGVGRCTFELPYPANSFALAARPPPDQTRRWLLHFRGSERVCCEPGRTIREAVAQLASGARFNRRDARLRNRMRLVIVARNSSAGSAAANYWHQGIEMAESDFCLVPAGDNAVSSRLYSAIAAGCIPVIIGGSAGAFSSHVPYHEFVLRVDAVPFASDPRGLLRRLAKIDAAEIVARRTALQRYAADLVYEAEGSRTADNFLRTAFYGCVHAQVETPLLSTYTAGQPLPPHTERSAPAEYGALPCVCAREEPKYWWAREREVSGWLLKRWPRINRELGGMSSVELCRCAHCGKTCSM